MPRTRATPLTKLIVVIIIAATVFFGFRYLNQSGLIEKVAPRQGGASASGAKKLNVKDVKDVIKVGVVTWGGYAGGQYFNGGFKASKESRYYKEHGILVEFLVMDDFNASRAAWKADQANLMWITADAFPTEVNALKEFEPRILFQADWSRGGDAIVVRRGINSVSDLKGKQIAVAYGTPSHTFILWMLSANSMSQKDVQLVEVPSAIDAASTFKAGRVDAAVVWSPDDEDCVTKVAGAKVLTSTKNATHIIADVFYAKNSYIEANEQKLKGLVEGWMRGAAEINSSPEAKKKAAEILSQGLGQDIGFCTRAIDNVRLCTFGDNKGFFEIDGCQACVTGEQLYMKMSSLYQNVGIITEPTPAWRTIVYTNILRSINLAGAAHEAEGMQKFNKASQQEAQAPAVASKSVSIVFPSGSFSLDDNAKYIIDNEVAPILKAFGSARVRVEGNTDNVGTYQSNITLSQKRAQAAVDHLIATYSFDANRFVVIGNGPDKPVASNQSAEGKAKNRRTEFQLLNQ